METTIDIKKRIHEFIENADERILRIFDAIISTEVQEFESISQHDKIILDQRLKDHQANPRLGEAWSEMRQRLSEDYGL